MSLKNKKPEGSIRIDIESIKRSKQIRDIFDLDTQESNYSNNQLPSLNHQNYFMVTCPDDISNKKNDKINRLYDYNNSKADSSLLSSALKLKKLPSRVSSSTCMNMSKTNSDLRNTGLTKPNNDVSKTLSFVPCINCSNLIDVNLVDSHTDVCNSVKDEVKQIEESKFAYHLVDFKLKKLKDNLRNIQENESVRTEFLKEMHIIEMLNQIVNEAISIAKIHVNSINFLKKNLINLDVSICLICRAYHYLLREVGQA